MRTHYRPVNNERIGVAEGDNVLERMRLGDDERRGRTTVTSAHRPGSQDTKPIWLPFAIAQMGLVRLHLRHPLLTGARIAFGKAHVKPR